MHKLIYCPQCGVENKSDAIFCQYCKNSFPEMQKEIGNKTQRMTNKQLKDYKMMLYFVIIVLTVAVLISLYALIT